MKSVSVIATFCARSGAMVTVPETVAPAAAGAAGAWATARRGHRGARGGGATTHLLDDGTDLALVLGTRRQLRGRAPASSRWRP